MRIAVASGKGGTGKTTVAVNLAVTAARVGLRTAYVDCDVEEPNGHIYLEPEKGLSLPVAVEVPKIVASACTACGLCSEICSFNAIAVLGDRAVVFPELCHGCGGCFLVCPAGAMERGRRLAGRVEGGVSRLDHDKAGGQEISFLHGVLEVREAMPLPVIREVKRRIPEADLVIVDCPPGNACPMVESVRGADRVVLVTEPTPFGLSDLEVAVRTVREMGISADIVVNRCMEDGQPPCGAITDGGERVIATIEESREMARTGSTGGLAVFESEWFERIMKDMLAEVLGPEREGRR